MKQEILISASQIDVSHNQGGIGTASSTSNSPASVVEVGTVLANMTHYGYVPSQEVLNVMSSMDSKSLVDFWTSLEATLKKISGDDKNMDKYVVYKNFPAEVLDMSQARYWFNQTLIYLGLPAKYVSENEAARPKSEDKKSLKVLARATPDSLNKIYESLVKQSARWNDKQSEYAVFLLDNVVAPDYVANLSDFGFKENGIAIIAHIMGKNKTPQLNLPGLQASLVQSYVISDATDVLRLAALLSGGDVSLREKTKFKNFPRSERKILLGMLENSKNLSGDVASRKNTWKKLLKALHPGDYNFKKVSAVYDELYNDKLETFNAKVEKSLSAKDAAVLQDLSARPGEFLRRLHDLYNTFGLNATEAFQKVAPQLTTSQLVKLDKYIETINERTKLMYPPKGNWSKIQVVDNKKSFSPEARVALQAEISRVVGARLNVMFPSGVDLDPEVGNVKLQTNDQKLASYGRGTVLDIPENTKFVRTASYWKNDPAVGTTWFDNGWNFFDSSWTPKFNCCWNAQSPKKEAIFSGDPVNSKEMEGRACQMIDLYFDKMLASGVRYGVWNILAFSHVKFSDAEDVMGTLQFGDNPEKGKLYEPARAQMVFPIKSETYTSYVAYIDFQKRKLVYMDAALPAQVSSAASNSTKLSEVMPAFVEYMGSLPTIHDVFKHAAPGTMPVLYSDKDLKLEADESGVKQKAYVFKSENVGSVFDPIDMSAVLEDASTPDSLKATLKTKPKM